MSTKAGTLFEDIFEAVEKRTKEDDLSPIEVIGALQYATAEIQQRFFATHRDDLSPYEEGEGVG